SFIERSTVSAAVDQVLFESLRQWRREEAQKKDVPPFVIFGDRTLREISQSFPQTKEQFMSVSGMGDRKWGQYGAALLKIVTQHSSQHGRTFQQVQRTESPTRMKKIAKGQTQMETWDFLRQGLDPRQIALKRGLALTTIESHLADLVAWGMITDISPFVSAERQRQISAVIQAKGTQYLKALKEALPEEISYGEIRMVVAGMRG